MILAKRPEVDRFLKAPDRSVRAAVIHGNKAQNARTRSLADFKNGHVSFLVATDIAARGLDVAQLPLVVNFDLPMVAEDYIHRVGRTGRAGASGRAVSLVTAEDRDLLRDIERLLPAALERVSVTGFEAGSVTRDSAPPARPTGPRTFSRPRNNQRPRGGGGRPFSSARPAARPA